MRLSWSRVKNIMSLGISSFMMAFTNSIVQVFCNTTLHQYGGDLYVGIMTVLNSIREITTTPVNGITSGRLSPGTKSYPVRYRSLCFLYTDHMGASEAVSGIFYPNL